MDEDTRKDVWGHGIPQYTKDDLLKGEDLLSFAMNSALWQAEFEGKNHKVIEATTKPGVIPNIVCEINGRLTFIVVKVSVAPEFPTLTVEEKKKILRHAEKFGANAYFAPIGIGAVDPARFEAGLTLKNDAYYFRYEGLKKIEFKKSKDWIMNAMREIRQLDPASQTRVYKGSGVFRVDNAVKEPTDFETWRAELVSPTFQEMLMTCIERKGMENSEFYKAALLDRKLFSAIKNNPDYQPKKETAVACCLGLQLCLQDAEKLLELAGYTLSMAIGWDRVIYYCLQNRIYDIDVVNEILWEEGEKCIRV
ncbi:MAG: hypothetical protein K6G34_08550 [Lachnospiraceae bacterium]|nr:hypothetical protein [Lachnospiraceae bacterium]